LWSRTEGLKVTFSMIWACVVRDTLDGLIKSTKYVNTLDYPITLNVELLHGQW
jgi:hypothetical protein